jgi:hypothetical protein
VRSGYLFWPLVIALSLLGVRAFGNPFSDRGQYRIEYSGKAGSTLWGSYSITKHGETRHSTTEKAIGKLPLTIAFTESKNAIVSANGSTANQEPIVIKIYKNGVECSNSHGTDHAGVTDTIVCR